MLRVLASVTWLVWLTTVHVTVVVKARFYRNEKGPVIGVVTQPCAGDENPNICSLVGLETAGSGEGMYSPSSYTKWIEAAGARVVFIPWNLAHYDQKLAKQLIRNLNGLLLTGGLSVSPNSPFQKAVRWMLFEVIAEFNNDERNIPIFGTCEGFEQIMMAFASQPFSILSNTQAKDLPRTMVWSQTLEEWKQPGKSTLFGLSSVPMSYKRTVYELFSQESIAFNDHNLGVSKEDWFADPLISGNFTLLASSVDLNGKEFVAMLESKNSNKGAFPSIMATQFHNEKTSYEWNGYFIRNAVHNISAVIANNYIAQVFVEQCRQSNQNDLESFQGGHLYDHYVSYRFDPIYLGGQNNSQIGSFFEQWYFW